MPASPITPGHQKGPSIFQVPTRTTESEKTKGSGTSITGDKDLDKACGEFESLFIYHLLKEMRASVPGDGYLGKSMQSDTYTSMFDLEIARELSSQRGIGLADFLRQQLANRLGDSETESGKKGLDLY